MRRIICIVIILVFLISCSKTANNDSGIIEINERVFVAHVNEIYLNAKNYLGRTIKIEGIFMIDRDYDGSIYQAVYRYGPGGCCGIDGIVGFEVKWAKDRMQRYPENNAWVEAVGELKIDDRYIFIELASITAKEIRGKEYVTQ